MSVKNRFQYQVATGRLTLPVAILLSLVFCGISFQGWESLGAWFMCACVTYLIIELNTTFALIRTRTSLPSAFFLVCFSVCPFLHTFGAGTFLRSYTPSVPGPFCRYCSSVCFSPCSEASNRLPHRLPFIMPSAVLVSSESSFHRHFT